MEKLVTEKKPTVLEVARRAKVSQAAVSTVLNAAKSSTIGVSRTTREKILRIAGQMGYVRNELARSLATGKTHTVGVLVHSLTSHFYTDFFKYLDDVCFGDGYSVFITSSEFDPDREARNLRAFQAKRVDALFFARSQPGVHDDILSQIAAQGIPVIMLGEVDVPGLPYPVVGFNEAKIGKLAAEFLWSMGHRNILYFDAGKTGDSSVRIHTIRWQRFFEVWKNISEGAPLSRFQTADSTHGGNELVEFLLKLPPDRRPTAVACSTDRLAISLMATLRTHQIRIPEDISVIGCDDIAGAQETGVPLTTIRLSTQKMAQGAWSLLQRTLNRADNISEPDTPGRVIVEPELIIRESVRTFTQERV